MARLKSLVRHWIMAIIQPRPLVGLLYFPRYICHWFKYSSNMAVGKMMLIDSQPCLGDWTTHTPFDAHYFYQGAWLARKLAHRKPAQHVDIGSSVLTVSVLSAFVNTTFVDYRPLKVSLPGLTSIAGNILDLPFDDDSVPSLSCLHVIEHIGLGRYGDPIDPEGSIKAADELQRIVSSGGKLFLSLPVGRERICFNAHRVHAPETVVKMFSKLKLIDFSYVNDSGELLESQPVGAASQLEYGCGLFYFEKP